MTTTKNPAAVALGKLGGAARAISLTAAQRKDQATKASHARTIKAGWPKGVKRGPRIPRESSASRREGSRTPDD
jgi:hypothetical protein